MMKLPGILPPLKYTILLICSFQVMPLFSQIKPMGQKGMLRAVVIGVSDYQNDHIPDLLFADADAKAFADYLRSPAGGNIPEDRVKFLTNKQATQGQMAAALTWLLEESKPGDQALIFFSGHGDMETQTMANYGFLLTYDAPASTYMAGGAFPVFYLQSIIQTLSAQKGVQVIMVADACHSGKLAGNATGGAQATAKVLSDQFANEAKILSCQPNEFSLEGPEWGGGHGVFTYYLIDGLTGLADANGDQTVTLLEIQRFLEDEVSAAASPRSQIPVVIGNKGMVAAKVDEPTLAALRARRLNESSSGAIAAVGSKGLINHEGQDTATMALYRRFQEALVQNRLLAPAKDDAYSLYTEIKDRPVIAPYRQDMRRNLAAALQDEAQQAINDYLAANPAELRKRWSFDPRYEQFPEYLGKAAEILGKDHFMYNSLKAKELYFKGLNLRLEGERESNKQLYQEATAIQQQVLQIDTNAAYAFNELGLLSRRKGDFEGSVGYFQQALSRSPTWALAETNLCGSFKDLGETDLAVSACRKALEYDSTFALAYHNLGVALADLPQYKGAISAFQQALRYDPDYYMTYFKLGEVYYAEQEPKQAKLMWKEAARLAPQFDLAFYNLGVVTTELGEKEEALQYFKIVTQLAPDDPDAYLDIADLEMGFGNLEASEAALADCFRLAPDHPQGFYLLSRLRSHQNRKEDSMRALQNALQKGFNDQKQLRSDPTLKKILGAEGFENLIRKYFPEEKN